MLKRWRIVPLVLLPIAVLSAVLVWFATHAIVDTTEGRVTARMHYLDNVEAQVRMYPEDVNGIRRLSRLYADFLLMEGTPIPSRIGTTLATSSDLALLGGTGCRLQDTYARDQKWGTERARTKQLAEHYLKRARELDPNLDCAKILADAE